jgi:putative membrane protein
MKTLCTLAIFLVSTVYAQTDSAKTATSARAMSPQSFLKSASQIDQAEIQLGQLAQTNASSNVVKQDGQRMVTDHTKLEDQVKSQAATMNVTLPSSLSAKDKALYDSLSGKTGASFDKPYVEAMISGHKHAIAEFEREANNGSNADVKALAEKALPTLQEHLQIWESAAKQLGYPTTSTTGGER